LTVIFYFKEDFISPYIAEKLYFDFSKKKIFIIPKDKHRRWKWIENKLLTAKNGILIALDKDVYFDKATIKELKTLIRNNKPVYIITIPELKDKLNTFNAEMFLVFEDRRIYEEFLRVLEDKDVENVILILLGMIYAYYLFSAKKTLKF